MNDRLLSRLQDALEAAKHIQSWAEDDSFEDLVNNIKIEVAYYQRFERIGEALRIARDIDSSFEAQVTDVHDWINLRHRLIHDYREIDLELLWYSTTVEIPLLIQELEQIIQGNP